MDKSSEKEQVNIRLSESMIRLVDMVVRRGYANDRSEFIRMSIVERLRILGITAESERIPKLQ